MRKICHILDRISRYFQKVFEILGVASLVVGSLSLFLQVVNRFIFAKIFHFSLSFTEELSRYAIIWFTYFFAGICYRDGDLIALNILFDRVPRPIKLVLYFLSRMIMLTFIVFIVMYVAKYIPTAMKFKSVIMKVPGIFLYIMPGIGFASIGFEIITEACGVLCGEVEPFCPRHAPKEEI